MSDCESEFGRRVRLMAAHGDFVSGHASGRVEAFEAHGRSGTFRRPVPPSWITTTVSVRRRDPSQTSRAPRSTTTHAGSRSNIIVIPSRIACAQVCDAAHQEGSNGDGSADARRGAGAGGAGLLSRMTSRGVAQSGPAQASIVARRALDQPACPADPPENDLTVAASSSRLAPVSCPSTIGTLPGPETGSTLARTGRSRSCRLPVRPPAGWLQFRTCDRRRHPNPAGSTRYRSARCR